MGEGGKTLLEESEPAVAAQRPSGRHRYAAIAVLLLVVVLVGSIRFRLRDLPLERDEGEYAYSGQLMLEGVAPYKLAYNMKLPGTYAMYAVMLALFGESAAGVHEGLIFINAAAILLVYLLAARLFGRLAAAVAAASYALLSVSPSVRGLAGHTEHFVLLFALAGILMLLKAAEKPGQWRLAASGLLLGLAFLMKQPGIFFGAFGWLYLALREFRREGVSRRHAVARMGIFSAGLALPFALTCVWMAAAGTFHNFWFWTVSYARQYGTRVGPMLGLEILRDKLPLAIGPAAPLWILAAMGLAALLWHRPARVHARFVLGFLLFSFAAVCPGFYFRRHYFILLLPAIALLIGLAVTAGTQLVRSKTHSGVIVALPAFAVAALLGFVLLQQKQTLMEAVPMAASRMIYGANPFPEAENIADYIRTHTSADERVAVLGSEPEIYFYAGRCSATGYIYTYGLMEPQPYALAMQQEMAKEIEAARPAYVVVVQVPTSWLLQPESNRWIFSWTRQYLGQHYDLDGIADIGEPTRYAWGAEAAHLSPRSPVMVRIFKRKVS